MTEDANLRGEKSKGMKAGGSEAAQNTGTLHQRRYAGHKGCWLDPNATPFQGYLCLGTPPRLPAARFREAGIKVFISRLVGGSMGGAGLGGSSWKWGMKVQREACLLIRQQPINRANV